MNVVILRGPLARDPAYRPSNTGTDWAGCTIETPPTHKTQRWPEKIDCVAFGWVAKALSKATAGQIVQVTGEVRRRKSTEGHYETQVVAGKVVIERPDGRAQAQAQDAYQDSPDDEIPF